MPGHKVISGVPWIRNYPPEEFKAHNQIWAIVQDQRGVMYYANSDGIIEYDGVSWRLILTVENTITRSLALGQDGRIYAGNYGEIGYLAPDSNQLMQYVSLLPKIEKEFQDFTDVWQTLAVGKYIYFVSQKYIFRWDGQHMNKWVSKTSFHVGFELRGKFYVRQQKVGLMQIDGDSLVMSPLGEQFANERVMSILPFERDGKQAMLMATRNNGLLLYDGVSVVPFMTDAEDILREAQVYCGTRLPNGQFAFGTIQDGVVVVDGSGHIRHHLNKASGLHDETIWYLYPDVQGGLWVGMHNGISRVEISSPFTHFGEREGIEGSVLEILRHQGRLYAASSMGIYYLDEDPATASTPGQFKRIAEISPQAWALLPFDDMVLAGVFDGVYQINAGKGKLINPAYAMSLCRSVKDPNRVFVGMQKGIKSLYYNNGHWRDEGIIEGIDEEITHIYETPEGKLWLTTHFNGMTMADFSEGYSSRPILTHFDTTSGLPDLERTVAFSSGSGLRFASAFGFLRFDEEHQQFIRDTMLVKGMPSDQTNIFTINEDRRKNLWVVVKGDLGICLWQNDGTYTWETAPFRRIGNISDYFAYPDPVLKNITWLGCIDRVIQYDGNVTLKTDFDFPTLIRQVLINGDSLLYGGASAMPEDLLTMTYGAKSMRINYAATSYDDVAKTEYQFMLEGYDEQWSTWTSETYKDYTGLPNGTYRFLVKARNIYGHEGQPAILNFKLLPPFYLTWWAYLIYAFALGVLGYGIWKGELARVQKKHLGELKQIEYDKLKELDQLKSRFFANITHEFRTPLTLILGPANTLISSAPPPERLSQYQMIRNNAQRLLRLINQLLDLSKLEAGKMKLAPGDEDIVQLVKSMVQSFESSAVSKKIALNLTSELRHAHLYIDRDKVEQILTNLLANAIKFTSQGGSVNISLSHLEKEGQIAIAVSDTGPGIAPNQLPHIFERFYQGDLAYRTGEPGSGIGLALAKELVELHNGLISAESTEGQGTTFIITLPFQMDATSTITHSPEKSEFQSLYQQQDTSAVTTPTINEDDLNHENTLLLVEDNPEMRAFVRDTLSDKYRIIEAVDGQDGVEKALERIPDLIISDVMMPRKDGLYLCTTLKQDERTSHIPIILLTSKADIESRLTGLERGADEYLAKPFNREELFIRIRNLLGSRQRLRERYNVMAPPLPTEEKDVQIEDVFLQKIRDIIEEHISSEAFEIDNLARIVGMSRSQLFRKVKALTGQSPSLFIRAYRLQRAKELLEQAEMNVSEVAYAVGFSSPGYFSDMFMESFGFRPSQLKK